jgi:hypothetical protein
MTPGYITRPQLGGRNRLGGAWQDRSFSLDHNASLEPNDREQFNLLSAKSIGEDSINHCSERRIQKLN